MKSGKLGDLFSLPSEFNDTGPFNFTMTDEAWPHQNNTPKDSAQDPDGLLAHDMQ